MNSKKDQEDYSGFINKNIDVIAITLIIICILLLICCALLSYMVFSYRNELKNFKKEIFNDAIIERKNVNNDILNITPVDNIDVTANPNNLKSISVVPATVLENDSMNDFTIYNSLSSKSYNKNLISMNNEDNVITNYASPKQAYETTPTSNVNDYLTHSYSYSANLDKSNKFQYNHRKNKSLVNNSSILNSSSLINNNHKRLPSIKKPKNLYERQSSISSTLGSVKSMLKRHYSIRSKNHSRNHSTNSKIPSILKQNNIPLNFINEELDSKSLSLNEYCQSVASSSATDNNNNLKQKLNYLSSSSNKIKFDEDLPITDILIPPSSSYSYSSKTVLCNNSYENYNTIYNDINNEEFINTVNNLELNNMYKENYNSNKIYHMIYSNKKPEDSIYSLSPFSNYSDNISYMSKFVNEPENEDDTNHQNNDDLNREYHRQELLSIPDTNKMNMNSIDISSLNIEYKKEE
ncbi:hypothetical protein BCR36DRAFT_361459 [Piromyces finnis]|uniref:Uncharacterized protein n=1 Tax=Piromyces finnis TaxID=1754191 RepID=A0A1Y1UXS6_9FUNG|nr:hypothetical protein BCR36DRAFT_361459 [Piromyces finnis]|eukprot:ORX43121.1 hypothetical protein BCR36DRAFT_361459 [Piromyces finnis]